MRDAVTATGVDVRYVDYGINPHTWEVHDAYARYEPNARREDSLVRVCGSRIQAVRTTRKLAKKRGCSVLVYDIVGPRERLARAVGKSLYFEKGV